ncbi:glycerol-3-phosphate dehydrogenase [Chitinivorax sp. PXF-14]|uniref:glycerol-3-phosphate dehydrogenase n=1 Tax=Chitinivorax sp. PXF-14 TaxID=3230488 RepID=UPI003465510F
MGEVANLVYDLLVIGGGINGVGIANEAAQRGLSVLVCEQDDLASHTSSRSSKLIHGGLRYLEYYEFRLVREALSEREVLLAMAPHLIKPMRFVLPHHAALRPGWMIRAGLFLYDHLGGRKVLPASKGLRLRHVAQGQPLKNEFVKGFEYSDCWVDDARLVVANALQAVAYGARVLTRTRVEAAERSGNVWRARIRDLATGNVQTVSARGLINAAGPWVEDVLKERLGVQTRKGVRLVKGSHIVVRKLYEGEQAYILQNHDGRIVFVIPYEQDFSLIGTTDVPYEADPAHVEIDADESAYLCRIVSEYFKTQIVPKDIVWQYSGVRPLFDDASDNPSAVTRDYVLSLKADGGQAPVLSVFGGKITTYRQLALHAMRELAPFYRYRKLPDTPAPLAGGDIGDFSVFLASFVARNPWLPVRVATRLARCYGDRANRIVEGARAMADLGMDYGHGLTEREVSYLIEQEWARSADDVLWRRTKLGLHFSSEQRQQLAVRFGDVQGEKPARLAS